jgi:uncharacterized protein (DUF433 family)
MTLTIASEPIPMAADNNGVVRVGGTRVTLDTVVGAFVDGCSAEEIVLQYPALRLADVYAVVSYYLRHKQEVDAYLGLRNKEAGQIRQKVEVRWDPAGIRERLAARQSPSA